MLRRNVSLKFFLAIALWLGAVVAGFAVLVRYQSGSSALATSPAVFPSDRSGLLDPKLPTLILCAHPHCPCTRATLDELDRVAARCAGEVRIRVLFTSAPELGEAWVHTDLWEKAARIPGVDVRADAGGALAHSLGARVSGEALLYSTTGRLLFHGGITSARGHAGDNAGEEAVVALATGRAASCTNTPIFGCRLVGAEDDGAENDGERKAVP
jgi:hypothetical protein